MLPLSRVHLMRLAESIGAGVDPRVAIPDAVGASTVCGGLWRLYSDAWPAGGISIWNGSGQWKVAWRPFIHPSLFCFGEDVCGNQLVLIDQSRNAFLWNHESGDCHDLLVEPLELLQTAIESGIDWIDFYSDGSLAVARQFGDVPADKHLHWTTPLVLGGQVSRNNLSVVDRELHLVGHAKLWSQISGLSPGSAVITK
jgi:hypothetical protein